MKKVVYYCYDAYCGWCYGFSPIINKLAAEYAETLDIEVLSGGMIMTEQPVHISVTASYIQKAYKNVEELTGVKFGEDYLWHIFHPDKSDWFPNSEKPAIALCIFKEYFPDLQVQFAADLQFSLHHEGRDLTDDEAYRHLLDKYKLPDDDFYGKLKSAQYRQKAHDEFAVVKQLQVTGYPTVLLQGSETRFYLVSRGYTDYTTLQQSIRGCLQQIASSAE